MVPPVLPLLVAAVAMAAPTYAFDLQAEMGAAGLSVHADNDGAAAQARSGAGTQTGDVRAACVPDWDSRCDTTVACDEGTLDCEAARRPRDAWRCHFTPDGSFVCSDGNTTQPPTGNSTGGNTTQPPPGNGTGGNGTQPPPGDATSDEGASESRMAPGLRQRVARPSDGDSDGAAEVADAPRQA